MNQNLARPWSDKCSPPQIPELTFYSRQSDDLLFDTGDTIELLCQAGLRAIGLRWTLARNSFVTPFCSGDAEALMSNRFRIQIPTGDLQPGFYDLRVQLDTGSNTVAGICTFGWRVAEIPIANTRPADFGAFWRTATSELIQVALDPGEEPLQSFGPAEINEYNLHHASLPSDYDPTGHVSEQVESGKVSFAGPDGGRVSGWLAKPSGGGKFPAMLVLPGAGFAARPRPLEHARHGYVALDIQVHGQAVDLPQYPTLPGYHDQFVNEPVNQHYFYKVHLRCLQALRYLASRPDVDQSRIVVVGGSQGGRLGIIVAALDQRVRAVVSAIAHSANIPYLAWVAVSNGVTFPSGQPISGAESSDGRDVTGAPPLTADTLVRCTAYYDPMNFAPDIRCPVLMNAGLIDHASLPTSVWAIYNRLGSKDKKMVSLDGLGHDWSAEFDRRAWRWLSRVLQNPEPERLTPVVS